MCLRSPSTGGRWCSGLCEADRTAIRFARFYHNFRTDSDGRRRVQCRSSRHPVHSLSIPRACSACPRRERCRTWWAPRRFSGSLETDIVVRRRARGRMALRLQHSSHTVLSGSGDHRRASCTSPLVLWHSYRIRHNASLRRVHDTVRYCHEAIWYTPADGTVSMISLVPSDCVYTSRSH